MRTQSMRAMAFGIGSVFFLSVLSAEAQDLPCVNANGTSAFLSRTITIQLQGKPEISVEGTITSVNTSTGEVGFKLPGLVDEQVVQPKTIKIVPKPQNMMAQMPLPVRNSLGPMKAKYPLKQVTVERGIVRYPKCIMADPGHEIAFAGTLTFQANELAVDGEFFDYSFPGGGPGTPQPDLTGKGKPGA
jgi:hypothetical protein